MHTERDSKSARRSAEIARARRLHGDTGAVLAEAALITPFFITMLFGLMEFGGAFRDYLTTANAALVGTRQAAIQGNAADADWNVIQAIKKATQAMPLTDIDYIVIFKASGPTTPVPAACMTASVSGGSNPCNRYTATQFNETSNTTPENWLSCSTGPSQYYCPTNRSVLTGSPGPDYLGVFVHVTHPWITGLFGKSVALTATSITRLEPQKLT
jgi:Flp pilus assembly protein TadG